MLYVSAYDICIHTLDFMGLNSQNPGIRLSRIILATLMPGILSREMHLRSAGQRP